PPRGNVTLRYAFGAVAPDAALPDFSGADLDSAVAARRAGLVYVDAGDEALKREMAWHASYLTSLAARQDYFEHVTINQGSAYLFLHGLDGAVRDFVFSAAPLSYIDPPLARETLLYSARMRLEATRAIAYATANVGQTNGVAIHVRPSDLDLFF